MSCFNCKRDSSYVAPARTNQNMIGRRSSASTNEMISRTNNIDHIGRESSDGDNPPKQSGSKVNKRFQTGASVMDRLGDISESDVTSVTTAFLSSDTPSIEGDWKQTIAKIAEKGGEIKNEVTDQVALESLLSQGYVMESYSPLMGSTVYLTREGADLICQDTQQREFETALESIIEDLTGRTPEHAKKAET